MQTNGRTNTTKVIVDFSNFTKESKIFSDQTVEKIKSHVLCSITLFFENRTFYVIMWKNSVELYRAQMYNTVHALCVLDK